MSQRACANCKHFFLTEEQQGFCRRYPPSAFPTGPGNVTAFFPPVKAEGLCGEWALLIEMATEMPHIAMPGRA